MSNEVLSGLIAMGDNEILVKGCSKSCPLYVSQVGTHPAFKLSRDVQELGKPPILGTIQIGIKALIGFRIWLSSQFVVVDILMYDSFPT